MNNLSSEDIAAKNSALRNMPCSKLERVRSEIESEQENSLGGGTVARTYEQMIHISKSTALN